MTDSPDDPDPALVRLAAQHLLDRLIEQQRMILAEFSAVGRWLTASLLAINGAGALAVFNAGERLAHPALDAAPFALGALAALASGVLNQRANRLGAAVTGEMIGRLILIGHTGEIDGDPEQQMAEYGDRLRRPGKWPPLAGWLSAALFGIGALATGVDRPPVDLAAHNRCDAIQHDMLSARPLRDDDIALFQALDCKSRGEGSVYAPRPR